MESSETSYSPDIQIDLRPYIKALFNRWWLIVLCGLLGGLAAILYSRLQANTYTAESNVSLLEIRVKVALDDTITTIDQSEIIAKDDDSRPEALLAIANSGALKAKVVGQTRDQLGLEEDDSLPVQLSTQRAGDMLRFLVVSEEPEVAAQIANLWANEFVTTANNAFLSSGSTPEGARSASDEAFQGYLAARSTLETFITNDQIDRLITEHNYVKSLMEQMYAERETAFVLANTARVRLDNQLLNATQSTVSDQVSDSVTQQLSELKDNFDYWSSRQKTLNQALLELEAVQAQLDAGMRLQSDIVSENLAALIAESGIASLGENNTFELDMNSLVQYSAQSVDTTTTGDEGNSLPLRELYPALKAEDVAPALEAVRSELIIAEAETARLSGEILMSSNIDDVSIDLPDDNRLYNLIDLRIADLLNRSIEFDPRSPEWQDSVLNLNLNEMLSYKQGLEAQILELRENRLTLERNKETAWETYVSLDNKAREVSTQFAAGAPQARLALQAFTPSTVNRVPVWSLPAAGLIGGLIGLTIVLGGVIREQVFAKQDGEDEVEESATASRGTPKKRELVPGTGD